MKHVVARVDTLQLEFENLVRNNLTYKKISRMSFEDYKDFVFSFFLELNRIRNEGIKKEVIDSFLNEHYSNVMVSSDDNDIMFERRFTAIMEELTEFCSFPHFWTTSFDVYMKKWERVFTFSWFENI